MNDCPGERRATPETPDEQMNLSWELVECVQRGLATDATPEEVREGDQAFAQIYQNYYGRIMNFALRRTDGDAVLAEDLTAETFVRAYAAISRFQQQERDYGAYLTTVCRNLIYDHYKAANTRLTTGFAHDWQPTDESHVGMPEKLAIHALERERVLSFLQQLTSDQRDVIILRYLRGFSIQETADHLGKTVPAVKGLALRAIGTLSRLMKGKDTAEGTIRAQDVDWTPISSADVPAKDSPMDEEDTGVINWESVTWADFARVPNARRSTGANEHLDALSDPSTENAALLALPEPWQPREQAFIAAANQKTLSSQHIEQLVPYIAAANEALERIKTEYPDSHEMQELRTIIEYGARARRIIAAHHLRFVVGLAVRFTRRAVEVDDIMQQASSGLMHAIDKYDPYFHSGGDAAEHLAFTAVAYPYVRGSILNYCVRERHERNLKAEVGNFDRNLLERSYQEARRENPDATYTEVGKWLGYSPALVRAILSGKPLKPIVRHSDLYHMVDPLQEAKYLAAIEDISAQEMFQQVDDQQLNEQFWQAIRLRLTPREYAVLWARYVNSKRRSEIALELDISLARVGQLLTAAHGKVRDLIENGPPPKERKGPPDHSQKLFQKLGIVLSETSDIEATRQWIMRTMDSLGIPPDAKQVISLHYGLETGGRGMTQDNIAARMSCAKSAVIIMERQAMRLLLQWTRG